MPDIIENYILKNKEIFTRIVTETWLSVTKKNLNVSPYTANRAKIIQIWILIAPSARNQANDSMTLSLKYQEKEIDTTKYILYYLNLSLFGMKYTQRVQCNPNPNSTSILNKIKHTHIYLLKNLRPTCN